MRVRIAAFGRCPFALRSITRNCPAWQRLRARSQSIVDEGEPAESLFNITLSAVKPCKLLPDGRRQSTGFLFEGDFWEAL